MRILITGSTGHLGEAIIRILKNGNHYLVGIDIEPSEYTTHLGSIVNREFVKACVKDIDVVIHTARCTSPMWAPIATRTLLTPI